MTFKVIPEWRKFPQYSSQYGKIPLPVTISLVTWNRPFNHIEIPLKNMVCPSSQTENFSGHFEQH